MPGIALFEALGHPGHLQATQKHINRVWPNHRTLVVCSQMPEIAVFYPRLTRGHASESAKIHINQSDQII